MEVVRTNFTEALPLIKDAIDKSVFIAFDTELTGTLSVCCYIKGLDSSGKKRSEIYDTIEERYQKVKDSATQFIISQYPFNFFLFSMLDLE